MEKILRKTITAFLVLLTIMIPVSAGIYLYQIQAGGYMQTKKMVLLK